ncbi:XRE family transcriptional regulator [Undibacterium amnicola]|uniref:XRE family transcriptional regulator n=1 Tax=Undibacterium amnicola TaxID=1834038 RepID=A0ABR6XUY1_9BURK|nr:XRE family transcriptional regulator [Undibacterium amnicola]MBC3833280.1 XRE family transcriptional regulator [Undibacterium amnicola]
MGRNLDDIIKNLPAKRQTEIAALSKQKVEEMIAHAATLSDFRKAVGKTQVEVAQELGIKQNAVSQLEKRSDTYVSTLRRFLKSLGLTLELSVVDKNGSRIDLPNFLPWQDVDSTVDASKTYSVPSIASGRKAVAAPVRKTGTKTVLAKKMLTSTKSGSSAAKKKTVAPSKRAGALHNA